jgi:hypothetical protein
MIKIEELRKIRSAKERLDEKERELTKPVLEDFSLLPVLYGRFKEILADMPLPPDPDSVIQRKKFLFVVIKLYSPASFYGYIVKKRLCKELSRMFGLTRVSISRNISDMLFFCEHFLDYRNEAEAIYEKIISGMDDLQLKKNSREK